MENPTHDMGGDPNLEEDEEDLVIGFENLDVNPEENQLCLVGRFISEQPVNFNLLKSRIAGVWRPQKGVNIKNIGEGRILFQFFHSADLQRVLDGSPWSFGSHPLILRQVHFGEIPLQISLNKLSFWIQVHDLPVGAFSEGVGRLLGNYIGRFVSYDDTNRGAVWRTYMRIRVELDVAEPLKTGKKIRIGSGDATWVKFKYERLFLFCFVCGRLGHTEAYCDPEILDHWGDKARRWGTWIKATDRRGQQHGGEKWLRDESGFTEGFQTQATEEGEAPAARRTENPGGDIHGAILNATNFKGKSTVTDEGKSNSSNQLLSFNAMITNPIYDTPCFNVERKSAASLMDDPRKRKRMEFLHATSCNEDKHDTMEFMHACNDDEHDTVSDGNVMISSVPFLSAGPGSGVCRD
ncbi:hypothetical protein ACS0TY_025471 [Phlomoides rotata]